MIFTISQVVIWCAWLVASILWARVSMRSEWWATFKDRFTSAEANEAAKTILILRGWQPGREGTRDELSAYPEFVSWLITTAHDRPTSTCLFCPDQTQVYVIDRRGYRKSPGLHYVMLGTQAFRTDSSRWGSIDARLKQMRCSYVRLLAHIDSEEFHDED